MKRARPSIPITERLADLSDPIRLRLLRLLENEQLSVGEVAMVVQLPQSTVSRHLKLLADGGWLSRQTAKTASFYRMILDDLAGEHRAIWLAVRDSIVRTPEVDEDDRRLASVLAARSEDSLAFFGRLAGEWDDVRQVLFGRTFTTAAVVSLVPPKWVVADLGCGTGNAAEQLAPCVERVIAVDQSEPMLEAAQKRLGGMTNVDWRVGRLEDLPLADAEVDAALCLLVLHYLDDPADALREVARALRTERGGGVAMVVDMYAHDRREYKHMLGHKHLGFTPEHMAEMFERAGLCGTRIRPIPADPRSEGPGLFAATAYAPGSALLESEDER